MALFVATARVYGNPQLSFDALKEFHTNLDRGINNWTQKCERLVQGFVLVDVTVASVDSRFLLITASYRTAVPVEFSLQEEINRSLSSMED